VAIKACWLGCLIPQTRVTTQQYAQLDVTEALLTNYVACGYTSPSDISSQQTATIQQEVLSNRLTNGSGSQRQ
jgi:hypothetical protein